MKKFVLGMFVSAALLFTVPVKAEACSSFFNPNVTPVTVTNVNGGFTTFFTPTNAVFSPFFVSPFVSSPFFFNPFFGFHNGFRGHFGNGFHGGFHGHFHR